MTLFEILLAAAERGEAVQMVTLVGAPPKNTSLLGQMLLLFPDGRVEGELLNADFTERVLSITKGRHWDQPQVLPIIYDQQEYKVFWNSLVKKKRAVILGCGHISQPLALFLAQLDYEITVIDDRPEFANQSRFPQADHVICKDFRKALQQIILDKDTAVVIVTRGHRYDLDCLRSIAGKDAGYIGMIGSRRRVKGVLQLLAEEGVSPNWLNAIKTPIGLDLGAQTPAEIALSIAAEIVAHFKGGRCLPLSQLGGGQNG